MKNVLVNTKDMDYITWKSYRKKGIGGSDVASICGISKYRSPYAVYLDKTNQELEEKENDSNDYTHFGTILEDIVAKEFSARTGKKVRRKNMMINHSEYSFMLANIDRAIVGEKAFLECKTTSVYNSEKWEEDKIPDEYMLQIQHYMAVLNYDYCYIACLIGGQKFVWKRIERDNDLINTIIKIEKDFWENHVLKKIPPTISENDNDLLQILYKETEENEIPLKSDSREYISRIKELKSKKEEIQCEINKYENILKDMLGNSTSGYIDNTRVIWKDVVSNRVDTNKLHTQYPEIYKACLNETKYRKFSIKERNDNSGIKR